MTLAAFERPLTPARPRRIEAVDVGRGVALLAMFIYHFAWDLSYFRLIRTDVAADPAWRWFAHVIAGSFLALVGASLVLAARGGIERGAFLRRLGLVAGAAALVTIGTYFFMPYAYVFFGILHHIAVASVLGLAFLRLPVALTALAAAIAFALPFLAVHTALDQPWLLWTGLSRLPVNSGDFVPLFPWFGCVLAGMVLARLALSHIGEERLSAFRAQARPWALLALMGRHSLPIYLVHQPLFIAVLSAFLWFRPAAVVVTPASDAEARPFVETCVTTCIGNGQEADICRDACQCTADGLRRDGLWRQALSGQMSSTERTRVGEIARICTRGE
jgi:uncharacterized membrane protein